MNVIAGEATDGLDAIATLESLFKGDYALRLRTGEELRLGQRYKDAVLALLGTLLLSLLCYEVLIRRLPLLRLVFGLKR
jgi:hypothetical protein